MIVCCSIKNTGRTGVLGADVIHVEDGLRTWLIGIFHIIIRETGTTVRIGSEFTGTKNNTLNATRLFGKVDIG